MNSQEHIIISLSKEELHDLIQKAVDQAISNLSRNGNESDNLSFITKEEASKLLKISMPSLTKYVKQGIIPAYRIGARILFKPEDIHGSLSIVQVKQLKNKML